MNRRQFLSRLGLGAAAVVAAPVLAHVKAAPKPKLSISHRFVQQFDVAAQRNITRMDVLYGWGTLRPEHACRIVA